jgi:ATP-dependent Lon protease
MQMESLVIPKKSTSSKSKKKKQQSTSAILALVELDNAENDANDIMTNKVLSNFVVYLQYKIGIKRKLLEKVEILYNTIFDIMLRIHSNYIKGIFSQEKYNNYMTKLDKILATYRKERKKLNSVQYKHMNNAYAKQFNEFVYYIKTEILTVCKDTGSLDIHSIFRLFDIDLSAELATGKYTEKYQKLVHFYNNVFVPISIYRYIINKNQIELEDIYKPQDNNNFLNIAQNKFKIDTNNDIKIITEIYQESDLKPICLDSKNTNMNFSLIEMIQGARLYLPINKYIIVCNGYFREDPLNISRVGGTLEKKSGELTKCMSSVSNVNSYFKKAYTNQIPLKDFIVYSDIELKDKCIEAHQKLNSLKSKTISNLVKEFMNSNLEEKKNILTLFLLNENDADTQYLAYLVYDMISNEGYLMKPQPVAEQVYNSLHWSVQKLFKVALESVNKYTNTIVNFNEEEIPYEKRICLMKAPNYIKNKAMDKFKEISQKSSENSTKAQQYLDGILKIPFGYYKKEKILNFLNVFSERLREYAINIDKVFDTQNQNSFNKLGVLHKNLINNQLNNQLITNHMKEIKCEFDSVNVDNSLIINLDKIKTEWGKLSKKKVCDKIKLIKNYFGLSKNISFTVDGITHTITMSKTGKADIVGFLIQYLQNRNLQVKDNKMEVDNFTALLDILNIDYKFKKISKNIKKQHNVFTTLHNDWDKFMVSKKQYLQNARKILDNAVHGHKEAKGQIERIIAQWLNGDNTGYCFGFEGPPGTGKTSLAKKGIAKCLIDSDGNNRPFSFLALGGSSNGSTLEGHSYTYVGSIWGRIVDILIETKCMNPIIFIDELDKVSNTEHGKELIGILTHLTDSTQNDEFQDKYFSGIKFDLSKALFIFSYNDPSLIDSILLDRIHRVKFKPLKKKDKFRVCKSYLLPEIFSSVGFGKDDIIFSDEVLEFIIDNYTNEAGARKLKEKLFEIIREINLRYLMGTTILSKQIIFPYYVSKEFIADDIFSKNPKMNYKKIASTPRVGLVNGLYASTTGLGGITIIESFKIPSETKLSLELTGQQGDVMKESMRVAKTVAWNILPSKIKEKINNEWEKEGKWGIHIHCPEGGTPKDGPSAGAAITLTIISLLTGIAVDNKIAMTGEIDLNGSVLAIGGLEAKLNGAKKAGVELALVPRQNEQDFKIIEKEDKELVCDTFKVEFIDNIWDVIGYALVTSDDPTNKHHIEFINYTKETGF